MQCICWSAVLKFKSKMYSNMQHYKIVFGKQAKAVHCCQNTRQTLLKVNAAILFNKVCKLNNITPKYTHIEVNGNNWQCEKNKELAIIYRLYQKHKFLHMKKQTKTVRMIV